MIFNIIALPLSYVSYPAYNGQSLQQKSNWVEFHIHRKKVYWKFVLIRWTLDGLIAGDGFEPPLSRIWALRDSASLSCDVHVWKNHFSTFTYWLLEEVTISPINSTHSELGYTFLRTAMCFSYHQTFSLQTMGKIGIEPIMFTTRERFYRPPQHRQSLPLSHNPDSRVSNRFIVLCFPLSTSFSAVDSLDIFMRLRTASLENSFY